MRAIIYYSAMTALYVLITAGVMTTYWLGYHAGYRNACECARVRIEAIERSLPPVTLRELPDTGR